MTHPYQTSWDEFKRLREEEGVSEEQAFLRVLDKALQRAIGEVERDILDELKMAESKADDT